MKHIISKLEIFDFKVALVKTIIEDFKNSHFGGLQWQTYERMWRTVMHYNGC